MRKTFGVCDSPEGVYHTLMDLGRRLEPYDPQWKIGEKLVTGCQSQMYLHATLDKDCMHYYGCSDALISAGLAAVLFAVYNEESPETVLTCPPTFLQDIGITTSLTPGRSNGLSSLYLKMKQEALNFLVAAS